jgi:hypothetical protein
MARPRKIPIEESEEKEPLYVLTEPGWQASGLKKRSAVSPTARRGRGRPPKSSLALERSPRASSDFESPRSQPRGTKRSHLQEIKQSSEEEEEEEENEEEEKELEESDEEEEEEEELELSPSKNVKAPDGIWNPANRQSPERRGHQGPAAPLRMNIATKVQRLRADPNFSSIRPETLSRVVEQFEHDPNTPSVIINTSVTKAVARRKAVRWTEVEVEYSPFFSCSLY